MKSIHELKRNAMSRIQVDPNSAAAQEMMRRQNEQAMAIRLLMEVASSIYVRRASLAGDASDEVLQQEARHAFRAAHAFLATANEPVAPPPQAELPPTDANGSPVEENKVIL